MRKRFIVDTCGTLVDMDSRDTFDYVSEVVDLLNSFANENDELKEELNHNRILLDNLEDKYRGLLKLVQGFKDNDLNE